MKIKKLMKAAVPAALLVSATAAMAVSTDSGSVAGTGGEDFNDFLGVVKGWSQGALGKGLAITMTLMGGAIGVAKNTPMPALAGLGGAAFLSYGPSIIESIFTTGAML